MRNLMSFFPALLRGKERAPEVIKNVSQPSDLTPAVLGEIQEYVTKNLQDNLSLEPNFQEADSEMRRWEAVANMVKILKDPNGSTMQNLLSMAEQAFGTKIDRDSDTRSIAFEVGSSPAPKSPEELSEAVKEVIQAHYNSSCHEMSCST